MPPALAAVLLIALAAAAPARGQHRVLVLPSVDGAIVRIPGADAADAELLEPSPGRVVLILTGAALPSRQLRPRSDWVDSVEVLGPDLLGGDDSRLLIRLRSSLARPRLRQEGRVLVLLLQARGGAREEPRARAPERDAQSKAPVRSDAGEGARERQDEESTAERAEGRRKDRREARGARSRAADDSGPGPRATRPQDGSQGRATAESAVASEAAERRPPMPRVPLAAATTPPAEGPVLVPAGEFARGTPFGLGFDDEDPRHESWLDDFEIDRTEVTIGQFEESPLTLPAQPAWNWRRDQPVVNVTWEEAAAFCETRGQRLPTEAEWEKAARGPSALEYPWGEAWLPGRANAGLEDDGFEHAAPVGSFPDGASPFGVLDAAGNVWEWVADWYDPEAYGSAPRENPRGPTRGSSRIVRGGGFESGAPAHFRAATRLPLRAGARRESVGFRCARSLDAGAPP